MYYFTPDTIAQANKQIASLDSKVGGLFCILHCLNDTVVENRSYEINGKMLRQQLITVFDKEPKTSFDSTKPSYIIFANDLATSFFNRYIKKKINLLACAIFFLRRNAFEREVAEEEVIDTFINRFNLQQYKEQWFFREKNITIEYNQADVEVNQVRFYSEMNYTTDFKSILFDGVIKKSASELKAAGQIQPLYSGSGIQTCFLLSDEPLDKYYIMNNSNSIANVQVENTNSVNNIAENILLYGVPGCGKSYTIKRDYCNDDAHMERTVFHPDYTYSDFVGQILPKVRIDKSGNKHITYEFEPGPFTRILKVAEKKHDEDFYLVIEEINRGNAPAIFGDIFQLLDRDDHGESEYGISNESIADIVYNDKTRKIKIPSNLYIIATMNTSDQNVFTLDTAFKRRWSMKRIENNIDACEFSGDKICDSDISWGVFANTINTMIVEASTENLSNEDNRLGAYFVKKSELKDSDKFGEKVLMYLWNDAFKYNHEKIFKSEYHTLDALINGFKTVGFDIFVDEDAFRSNGVEIDKYLEGKKEHLLVYYNTLRDIVKAKLPDIQETSTKSLQYAAWQSDNINKVSFADLMFQDDKLLIFTEIPKHQKYIDVGEEVPRDNHHNNHYYKIIYNDDNKNKIADIIVESYEQLKKG